MDDEKRRKNKSVRFSVQSGGGAGLILVGGVLVAGAAGAFWAFRRSRHAGTKRSGAATASAKEVDAVEQRVDDSGALSLVQRTMGSQESALLQKIDQLSTSDGNEVKSEETDSQKTILTESEVIRVGSATNAEERVVMVKVKQVTTLQKGNGGEEQEEEGMDSSSSPEGSKAGHEAFDHSRDSSPLSSSSAEPCMEAVWPAELVEQKKSPSSSPLWNDSEKKLAEDNGNGEVIHLANGEVNLEKLEKAIADEVKDYLRREVAEVAEMRASQKSDLVIRYDSRVMLVLMFALAVAVAMLVKSSAPSSVIKFEA